MSERATTVQPTGQIVPVERGLLSVRQMLGENAKGIGALLGQYMPMERFCGAVLTLCRHNPDLTDHTKASRPSLLLAVMRIAQLQLSPDPSLGQAWIVPRRGRAEMQLGYRGCIALAYRSPLVSAVRYGIVGPRDRWEWRDGRDFVLRHEPTEEGWPEILEEIRCAWAIIETVRGGSIPRVMYRPEIIRHKNRGQGSQSAWTTDPAAMAVKTVLADVCRRGPFDAEVARGFQLDHLGEIGKGQPEDGSIDVQSRPAEPEGEPPAGSVAAFKAAHEEPLVDPEQAEAAPADAPPALLGEKRAGNLLSLARSNGVEAELIEEVARLTGSGDVTLAPASCETDLIRFVQKGKASRPKGKR